MSFGAPASAGTKRDFTPKFHLAFDGSCWSVFTSLSLIKSKIKTPLCVVGVRVKVVGGSDEYVGGSGYSPPHRTTGWAGNEASHLLLRPLFYSPHFGLSTEPRNPHCMVNRLLCFTLLRTHTWLPYPYCMNSPSSRMEKQERRDHIFPIP